MKRTMAIVLGAVMTAGLASPASAASLVDFSGYYRSMYMNETNTGHGRASHSFNDSYFQSRLQLDLAFSPTDEISVHWRLRGPGSYQRWGQSGNTELYTQHIYAEVKQEWGTVLVGRISDELDAYGLASLGYMPQNNPVYSKTGAFDRGEVMDGARYSRSWDNGFSLLAQYVKINNNNQEGGLYNYWPITDSGDQDYDRLQTQLAYAWDGGGVSLNLFYDRDASPNGRHGTYGWGLNGNYNNLYYMNDFPSYQRPINPVIGSVFDNGRLHMVHRIHTWGLNPAFMHSWGDFSLHFEGMGTWGTTEFRLSHSNRWLRQSQHGEGYGAYLDLDYNYGPAGTPLWPGGGFPAPAFLKTRMISAIKTKAWPILSAAISTPFWWPITA